MGQALELDGESFKAEGREKLIKEEYQIKLTSVRIPQSPSYAHIPLDLRWPRWRLNSRYLGSPVPNTRGGWKVYAVWFGGLHKMNGNVNHVSPLRTLLSRPDQPKDKMKKKTKTKRLSPVAIESPKRLRTTIRPDGSLDQQTIFSNSSEPITTIFEWLLKSRMSTLTGRK